jgi:acyl-CoA synthetase (AMP-forming)/AMP-acid ligase II
MSAPAYATLVHAIAARAEATPDRIAATYGAERLTFGALWRGVESASTAFVRAGVGHGDRVIVALPNGLEFFPAFYGAQLCGAIAVPVLPTFGPARLGEIAERCSARAFVVADERMPETEAVLGSRAWVACPSSLRPRERAGAVAALPAPDDVAFIQYTSGSTGEPKGVLLTHGSLADNARQMIEGMEITPDERFVSWLPVYHDMGLILKTMVPMLLGAETHLLPTSLTDVDGWLETIERVKGTFTAAPDFAWRLCLRRPLKRRYDLSSLRVGLDAAEPVRAETLRDFERTFGLGHVMTAGYGLAEATVGVSMTRPGEAPAVDDRGNVSVGKPFPGVEIQVRAGGAVCGAGETGEVHVRTVARSRGYDRDPEGTRALFDESGFLATGDIGYVDSRGELTVVGRVKNTVIVAGRTVAPREAEEAAEVCPLVRFAAAVGIDRQDRAGEQLVVLAEVRPSGDPGALDEATRTIVRSVHDKIGLRQAEVVLLAPNTIPRTPNGKIQHAKLRALYLAGSLVAVGRG